jgi:hypothetical protein
MLPTRFSLAALMFAVLCVAVGFAALHAASEIWATAAFQLTILILLVAVVAAVFGGRGLRPFSSGVAVFGWAYIVLAFGPWFTANTAPHLLTTKSLEYLHQHISAHPLRVGDKVSVLWGSRWWRCTLIAIQGNQYLIRYDGYSPSSDEWVTAARIRGGEPIHFLRIGQSLWSLIHAVVGGVIAQWMYSRRRSDRNESSDSATMRAPQPDTP